MSPCQSDKVCLCPSPLISCNMLTHIRSPFPPSFHHCQLTGLPGFPTPICPFSSSPHILRRHMRMWYKSPWMFWGGKKYWKEEGTHTRRAKKQWADSALDLFPFPRPAGSPVRLCKEERRAARTKYCVSRWRSPPASLRGSASAARLQPNQEVCGLQWKGGYSPALPSPALPPLFAHVSNAVGLERCAQPSLSERGPGCTPWFWRARGGAAWSEISP